MSLVASCHMTDGVNATGISSHSSWQFIWWLAGLIQQRPLGMMAGQGTGWKAGTGSQAVFVGCEWKAIRLTYNSVLRPIVEFNTREWLSSAMYL